MCHLQKKHTGSCHSDLTCVFRWAQPPYLFSPHMFPTHSSFLTTKSHCLPRIEDMPYCQTVHSFHQSGMITCTPTPPHCHLPPATSIRGHFLIPSLHPHKAEASLCRILHAPTSHILQFNLLEAKLFTTTNVVQEVCPPFTMSFMFFNHAVLHTWH